MTRAEWLSPHLGLSRILFKSLKTHRFRGCDACFREANGYHRGREPFFNAQNFALLDEKDKESICQLPLSQPTFFMTILMIWTFTEPLQQHVGLYASYSYIYMCVCVFMNIFHIHNYIYIYILATLFKAFFKLTSGCGRHPQGGRPLGCSDSPFQTARVAQIRVVRTTPTIPTMKDSLDQAVESLVTGRLMA